MTTNHNSSMNLRSVLEKEKLNGKNFLDWHRNLRIVLKQEKKAYVFDEDVPDEPASNASKAVKDAYNKHVTDLNDVTCLMLATMDAELQKLFEDKEAFEILAALKEMFQEQARNERYNAHCSLVSCKMQPNSSVSNHILKMKGYIDQLDKLGAKVGDEMATDLILRSLPPNFKQFVQNFNMHNMSKNINEMHGMLKNFELTMKANVAGEVLVVQKAKGKRQEESQGKAQWQR